MTTRWRTALPLAGALLVGSACDREQRTFRDSPPSTAAPFVRVSDLQPGGALVGPHDSAGPYADNAYAQSEGQQLFNQMNCSGCHSHGGGGIGPPLMDAQWIYGSEPSQIFATIVEGRPNGMPSFRGKLSNDQVWALVAYVRSLSGIGRRDVRSGRADEMTVRSSPQNTQHAPLRNSATPPASEMP